MTRYSTIAIAVVALAGTPAFSAPLTDPAQMITSFDTSVLVSVAETLGFTGEVRDGGDRKIVFVKVPQGGGFYAVPKSCDLAGRCIGFEMLAAFTAKVPVSRLNDFNVQQSYVMAWSKDGDVRLSRDEWVPFGTPAGNIAAAMNDYNKTAAQFATFLGSGSGALNTPALPTASPAFASLPSHPAILDHVKLDVRAERYGLAESKPKPTRPHTPSIR